MISSHRHATKEDAFSLLRLYQKARTSLAEDKLFLDYKKLEQAIELGESVWIVTTLNDQVVAVVSMVVDTEQRLAKISRLIVDPDIPNAKETLRGSLKNALMHLQNEIKAVDLVYTTTLSMSIDMQEITLEEGFKIAGVFPNALGADKTQLNGLTVYYFNNALEKTRYTNFSLHPAVKPFFNIVMRELNLPDVPVGSVSEALQVGAPDPLPHLELIRAPYFVNGKFQRVKQKQAHAVHFYPFYTPNALVTDPEEEIEIYVRISDTMRFAAIIGEHTERAVDPVQLYEKAFELLKEQNVVYVEIINDAADIYGTECILKAGFTPCAYIPAFKRQGESRRDYAVFGKSFEYLCRPVLDIPRPYIDFFKQYFKVERKNFFHKPW